LGSTNVDERAIALKNYQVNEANKIARIFESTIERAFVFCMKYPYLASKYIDENNLNISLYRKAAHHELMK